MWKKIVIFSIFFVFLTTLSPFFMERTLFYLYAKEKDQETSESDHSESIDYFNIDGEIDPKALSVPYENIDPEIIKEYEKQYNKQYNKGEDQSKAIDSEDNTDGSELNEYESPQKPEEPVDQSSTQPQKEIELDENSMKSAGEGGLDFSDLWNDDPSTTDDSQKEDLKNGSDTNSLSSPYTQQSLDPEKNDIKNEEKPADPSDAEDDFFVDQDGSDGGADLAPVLDPAEKEQAKEALDEADRAGERVDAITDNIQRANNELYEFAMEMDAKETSINETREKIKNLSDSLANIKKEQEVVRQYLDDFIRFFYESRMDFTVISSFLRSHSFGEFLNRQYYISQVIHSFMDRLQEYEALEALIDERTKELDRLKEELDADKKELTLAQEAFEKEISSLSKKLAKAQKQANDARMVAEQWAQRLAAMEEAEEEALENADPFLIGESSSFPNSIMSDGTDFWESSQEYDSTEQERILLAGIIQAEAGNQPYEGKIAVGSVVMNRVDSPKFPNTISSVIYSPNQFTPAGSGRLAVILAQGPTDECLQAATDVLNGKRNVENLYFKSAGYAAAHGITGIQIADQVFH